MCRSADFPNFRSAYRDRLRIRGFYVRFSGQRPLRHFPESLTLIYLPRISENSLEIDGSKIRPDLPAFVTLYRIVSEDGRSRGASYGSRDRVYACEGLRFEVYLGEEKALKGVFRRDDGGEWAMECRCALQATRGGGGGGEADVSVAVEGRSALMEKVEMVAARRKVCRPAGFHLLEEIPEEREMAEDESDDCCCGECMDGESGWDGREAMEFSNSNSSRDDGDDVDELKGEMEVNTDGVKWAVDLGIWVMCLGVGIWVSRGSAMRLRHRRLF